MDKTSGIDRFILDKLDKFSDKLEEVHVNTVRFRESLANHEKKDHEMYEDIKKISSDLAMQSKLLDQYNAHLKEHMRRTELNEEAIKHMHTAFAPIKKKYETDNVIKAYSKRKWKMKAAIIATVGTLVGIAVGLTRIFW